MISVRQLADVYRRFTFEGLKEVFGSIGVIATEGTLDYLPFFGK